MLKNIYKERITLFNKLKRKDSLTNVDIWYKTILDDVVWYRSTERDVLANGVAIGDYITILVPFNESYIPYNEWKVKNMQTEHYTISVGDYVVKGEVDDNIDSSNIVKELEKYGEDVCLVKSFKETHERFGANVQLRIQGI